VEPVEKYRGLMMDPQMADFLHRFCTGFCTKKNIAYHRFFNKIRIWIHFSTGPTTTTRYKYSFYIPSNSKRAKPGFRGA
jgi:hypothetical protein